MMGVSSFIGILAGIISFSAYLFYILSILRGQTKPSRTTWFILSFISVVIVASYDASGAEDTLWVAVSNAFASIVIALLSIKNGVGGSTRLDIFCFVGSVGSLILWWLTDSALLALIANLVIDLLALIPTMTKSWLRPEEEGRLAWTLTLIGNTLNFFAITEFTFGIIIYPIYFFVVDLIITIFLYRPLFRKHVTAR